MPYNEYFMQKAYENAETAKARTGINPNVGAVIVKDNKIVGMGCSQECGKNHAEIEALIAAGDTAQGADLYVTLEPCCHQGKTPPCTSAIIKAGIKKVYAGIQDPNPCVGGGGFKILEEAGIEVEHSLLKDKIEKQLEIYLTYRIKKRPFFIMKNAVSLDGKIAVDSGASKWITSAESRQYVQNLRKEVGAVLTGINTVLADDPLLAIRPFNEINCRSLLRVVLDSKLKVPIDSQIVTTADKINTLIITTVKNCDKADRLTEKGLEIAIARENKQGEVLLEDVVEILNRKEITSVLIEAGRSVNSSFLRERYVDKIYYFIAPKILGGSFSVFKDIEITTPNEAIGVKIDQIDRVGEDILIIGYPQYKESTS